LSARELDAAQLFSSGRSMTKAGGHPAFHTRVNGITWQKAVPFAGTASVHQ
jgi:hypothetical protein